MLRLALLGTPEVSLQGRSILDQLTGRGLALTVYLVVTGQPHTRGRLADLLWHEVSSEDALKKMRHLLPRVRPLLDAHLQITRETIAFDPRSNYWLDVDILRTHLAASSGPTDPQILEKVLTLYRDDFLADLSVRDAAAFEEWVVQQREEFHRLAIQGFHRLADHHLKQGDSSAGLVATRRLLTLEPWREEAHRQQMLLLASQGDRTAALTQFTLCQRVLMDEFGIEPTAETVLLYEQIRSGGAFVKSAKKQATTVLSPVFPSTLAPQVNWDEIPRPLKFYGREGELKTLGQWLTTDGCRLVGVFGIGGQGKSALVARWLRTHFANTPQQVLPCAGSGKPERSPTDFAHIVWCSLVNPPPLTQLLQEWLTVLAGGQSPDLPVRLERQLALLLYYLRQQRCLLVLDNLEHVLQTSPLADATSGMRADYEAYSQLLHWLATCDHQSCLLVISRERPLAFTRWEEHTSAVRALQLSGLTREASQQLLQAYGLTTPAHQTLAQHYAGCPLALIVAAETIHELFAGNAEHFLAAKTWVLADLHTQINRQFVALTAAEQSILLWLAVERVPLTFEALWSSLVAATGKRVYLDACRSLLHRSLIELQPAGFVLPNVVLAYLTEYLVENMAQELVDYQGRNLTSAPLLNTYRLLNMEAAGSILDSQTQLLLQPIVERLLARFSPASMTNLLQVQLEALLAQDALQLGYAQTNLHHLLLQLEVAPQPTKQPDARFSIPTPLKQGKGMAPLHLIRVQLQPDH